jgi:hypothetical protein
MFRRLLLLLALLGMHWHAAAQRQTISGYVDDTMSRIPLQGALVTVIKASDTTLYDFTRAGADGSFSVSTDTAGTFILEFYFPSYALYRTSITLAKGKDAALGHIPLVTKAHLLEEFVFRKKQSAIRINGDTTEFAADSFKVQEGASVEELLKKLPGIQIDQNGNITAQGETVQKVLVDGEEFFSDDPALVTQTLRAKTVETVQVYDKKSDAALQTGIDDGKREKTINLKLKENMKKGAFGKAQASGGTDGYYDNQLMVNAFKGKRQLSLFGIMGNAGTTGLGWADRNKYGGNNSIYIPNEIMVNSFDELFGDGQYSGEGIPTVKTGGVHYANKWNEDKEHVISNYRYSDQSTTSEGNTNTQYLLPDSILYTSQHRASNSSAERQAADARFDINPDTASSIGVTLNYDLLHNVNNSSYYSETRNENSLINNSRRQTSNDIDTRQFKAALSYSRKFARKGRSMYFYGVFGQKTIDGIGYLFADNHYFAGQTGDDTTDQYKTSHSNVHSYYSRGAYTEPLSKILYLNVGYSLNIADNEASLLSYNRRAANEWNDVPDTVYSSSYKYAVTAFNGSSALNLKLEKLSLLLGASFFQTVFNQDDLFAGKSYKRSYQNYAPSAVFRWSIRKQTNLSVDYEGRTEQPTLQQIQPIRQNPDPLNITVGNPDLKQAFTHQLGARFSDYKTLKGRSFYIGTQFWLTQDAISQTQTIDNEGRRVYQYINVNGNYSASLNAGTDWKFQKQNLRLSASTNIRTSHDNNVFNGTRNESDNNSYTFRIGFTKDWAKGDKTLASLSINPDFSYNENHASISVYNNSYWSSGISGDGYVTLPWKLQLNSSVRASLRQRLPQFDKDINVVLWNAWVSEKLLKGDVLECRFTVYDILDQNKGLTRSAQANYIVENSYNTLRRRAMLSVIYNFNYSPAVKKAE